MPKFEDLKKTLNLPRTTFPMKASLPQNEPKQLAEWEEKRLYHRIQESRAGAKTYLLHDGPPYPTGTIHLGTGLNKILKDLVVKSKAMAGFRSPYVPGWDCHGLPIETQVEKELGGKKGSVPPGEFRRMCREFATRYVDQHRRDFKRLGIFGQWEDPYLTMSPKYEAAIAEAFITFLEKGFVYRGLKPVFWCIVDSTALAEAEVEYENHTSPSIWVRFPLEPGAAAEKFGVNLNAAVWTTTPWTLPANRALAFHPDFDYVVAETSAGALLLASELLGPVMKALQLEPAVVRGPWKGKEFEGLKFRHPFLELVVPGVLADYVTLEQGTGIVHTAPGHGTEDYQTGQKYGLETYAPLDNRGRYVEGLPEYNGKTVFEANPEIIKLLRARGALLGEGKLTHSYPHCWRCHNPVIIRATEQWFIDLDRPGRDAGAIRPRALDEITKVQWTPEWGAERMRLMVSGRPDWCVSRQRFWGVPLVIIYCTKCGKQFKDYAALRAMVRHWFAREGADAWFTHSLEELLPAGTRCECGAANWRKEDDILDVWFDSGSSHLAVLDPPGTPNPNLPWPADIYLEGPDQFRGWFQSSLLIAIAIHGASPFRHVLTHGWTLDAKGQPMSKSLGNVMEPAEVCEKWGADLLRLWVTSQDFTADVRMSEAMMAQLSEAYRKLRNTFRFALSNLFDFDPSLDAIPETEMEEMDRWMLARTGELVRQCRAWYDAFEFHRVYHAIHDFTVVDLSAFYFDVLKDRLYTFAARNRARRSAQTAVYRISSALLRLIAPILAFTSEEIWKFFPRSAAEPESVHVSIFPRAEDLSSGFSEKSAGEWEFLLKVRGEVLKVLEEARNSKRISGALEARVFLSVQDATFSQMLKAHWDDLRYLFIVSSVEPLGVGAGIVSSQAIPGLSVLVQPAAGWGKKCERCWNYSPHVGKDADDPRICERCVAALAEIERDLGAASAGAKS